MSTVAVIIPAAGRSARFGGPEKKPFVQLGGRPLWQRSVELFLAHASVVRVYLVLAADDRAAFIEQHAAFLSSTRIEIVDGGEERFESVANALNRVHNDIELVAVHDAVRPLTPMKLIDAVFAAAAVYGAAMPAIPVADTLKRVDDMTKRITETVPRAGLWAAQTPQVFRRDWLVAAYAKRGSVSGSITDDAQLVESLGHAVYVVPGSPINFKITTRDDLALAEAVLAQP